MEVKRNKYLKENQVVIQEDNFIHNLVTPELKELQKENDELQTKLTNLEKMCDENIIECNRVIDNWRSYEDMKLRHKGMLQAYQEMKDLINKEDIDNKNIGDFNE